MENKNTHFLSKEKEYWNKVETEYESLSEQDYNQIFSCINTNDIKGNVLELGCGTGAFGKRLIRKFPGKYHMYGIDISHAMLKMLAFPGITADGASLPFKDNSLDLVVFSAALHHIRRFEEMFGELKRCLVKGGIIVMYEPNVLHPFRKILTIFQCMKKLIPKYATEVYINLDDLLEIAGASFALLDHRYLTFRYHTPSILGKLQYRISRCLRSMTVIDKYLHPWFLVKLQLIK